MRLNKFLKILLSIPVILIMLYFIPFLGICLLLFRCYFFKNKSKKDFILFIILGVILLIPNILGLIFKFFDLNIKIVPYLENILSNNIYKINIVKYGKFIFGTGIIFIILSYIVQFIFNNANNKISKYFEKQQKKEDEISLKNDLIMKEKREKSKNTNFVKCPYCGADNIISTKTGTCAFCRRKIENPNFKNVDK